MSSAPAANRARIQELLEGGDVVALVSGLHEVLQEHPRDPWLLHLAAIHETSLANHEDALQLFARTLEVSPTDPQVHYNYGTLFQQLGRPGAARSHLERAVQLRPDYPQALCNLGALLTGIGELDAAILHLSKSVQLQAENPDAAVNLATALRDVGLLDDSLAMYEAARAANPQLSPVAESNNLLAHNYNHAIDDQTLCRKHLVAARRWDSLQQHSPAIRPGRGRDEKLHIGYVSPDFRTHSVAFFMEGILEQHDRKRFHIHGYPCGPHRDKVTERLRGHCDSWTDLHPLNDSAAAEQILADEIDILVDLAGHTAHNRLGVFAHKPAPIQVTYLGYGSTTGLSAMDYRITDAHADPADLPWHGSEQLVRLASGFQAYQPATELPELTPPPSLDEGNVTFASFNILPKHGSAVLREWAAILQALPGSRLLLKARQLASELGRRRIVAQFAENGIEAERLVLLPHVSSFAEHMALYCQVDIGLDPFPYNGATTTCEALSMGVPVVTLRGERHVGRVGASILTRVGLPELVADSLEEYREVAVRLATDSDRRNKIRGELREQLMNSSLTDAETLTRELEQAYLEMLEAARSR